MNMISKTILHFIVTVKNDIHGAFDAVRKTRITIFLKRLPPKKKRKKKRKCSLQNCIIRLVQKNFTSKMTIIWMTPKTTC